ncbi:hypothetical protein GCM10009827_033930 [Dactylosporangium maewongense]|uniref:Uncharacterized protein n=1 Tax=Dactylosporangium maewongense TaxID=634393 RepID=A0ABP4L4X6_9ACTN
MQAHAGAAEVQLLRKGEERLQLVPRCTVVVDPSILTHIAVDRHSGGSQEADTSPPPSAAVSSLVWRS